MKACARDCWDTYISVDCEGEALVLLNHVGFLYFWRHFGKVL